jgi:hypothetical protein
MMNYNDLNTSSKKGIKMKMKTSISLYGKGNEIVSWCTYDIWSYLLLNDNYHYMHWHGWCTLHHIWVGWINYDNVYLGPKIVSSYNNINLSPNVAKKKVGINFFWYKCSTFSKAIVVIASQRVSWVVMCLLSHGH